MASSSALILIDLLVGVFELPVPLHQPARVVANLERLLTAFRQRGALVVHVRHQTPSGPFATGTPGADWRAELAPRGAERIIAKRFPDMFQDTELASLLRAEGIEQLVLGGFATEGCIDTSVRSAFRLGFQVVLVADGHTTTANEVLDASQIVAHHNVVLGRFAEVLSTEALLTP